jgi:hypothetical protein
LEKLLPSFGKDSSLRKKTASLVPTFRSGRQKAKPKPLRLKLAEQVCLSAHGTFCWCFGYGLRCLANIRTYGATATRCPPPPLLLLLLQVLSKELLAAVQVSFLAAVHSHYRGATP